MLKRPAASAALERGPTVCCGLQAVIAHLLSGGDTESVLAARASAVERPLHDPKNGPARRPPLSAPQGPESGASLTPMSTRYIIQDQCLEYLSTRGHLALFQQQSSEKGRRRLSRRRPSFFLP